MAFRFFRRMKIAPGVTLNFSKSGISTSFGVRGAKVTVGPRGVRRTVGLPGTGLFYTETGSGAAEKTLKKALARQTTLGRYFDKYGLSIELGLPITKNLVAYNSSIRRWNGRRRVGPSARVPSARVPSAHSLRLQGTIA